MKSQLVIAEIDVPESEKFNQLVWSHLIRKFAGFGEIDSIDIAKEDDDDDGVDAVEPNDDDDLCYENNLNNQSSGSSARHDFDYQHDRQCKLFRYLSMTS